MFNAACDCHVHVIDDPERYPLSPERGYEPPQAPLANYRRFQERSGLSRAVLVQPSVYGFDNRLLRETISQDRQGLRGIVVPAPHTPVYEFEAMHADGVCGVRVNLLNSGGLNLDDIEPWLPILRALKWHLQVQIDVNTMADTLDSAIAYGLPVVVDHFGFPRTSTAIDDPGIANLLTHLRTGRCWVKLSAAYRLSTQTAPPYSDLDNMVAALVEAAPGRVVWASDWPHTECPPPGPNSLAQRALVDRWLPDPELRQKILVDNPAYLYRFGA